MSSGNCFAEVDAEQGDIPGSLHEILSWRAGFQAARPAYRFIADTAGHIDEAEVAEISYADLDSRVTGLAAVLSASLPDGGLGERVLLLCPPGLDFIAAFFACLRAGMIAVPMQPPSRRQDGERWRHIVEDAEPAAIVTTRALRDSIAGIAAVGETKGKRLVVIVAEEIAPVADAGGFADTPLDSVAMLQYTSGSTLKPKGVTITHGNLLANLEQIRKRFAHSDNSRGLIWLPPYHDMGLIGGILQPLYVGFPVALMAPASFLRRPARWLQAISKFAATTSGGPNFSYEYCLAKCGVNDLAGVDLSSWQVAFNGAERVRHDTQRQFAERFEAFGFNPEAFLPCYGLAEATLLATSAQAGRDTLITLPLDRDALRRNRVKSAAEDADVYLAVACGTPADATVLRIADPDTLRILPEGQVGEICLAGPSVTPGYWRKPAENRAAFVDMANGFTMLRTGDLGFLDQGRLYVTGRLKELIVIRGANYAPQDIECSIQQAHSGFLPAATAVFSVDGGDGEEVVAIQELARGSWSEQRLVEALAAASAAVSRDHGLRLRAIALVKMNALPKTPSGKMQRHQCKALFLENRLPELARWPNASASSSGPFTSVNPPAQQAKVDELLDWLRGYAETSIDSRLMDERRSLSPAVLLDFGNRGLLGMQVPTCYDGLGLNQRSSQRIIEQLAAIDATLALFVGLNNVLGIGPILHAGNPELRENWLPRLASGRELAAFALTEADAGSHPHAMQANAVPVRNGVWRLNGRKIWSGSASWSGIVNVFVRQCDALGQVTGTGAYAIPRGRPGLQQGSEALTMGMRAMVQNTVILNDVEVSEADQLGSLNDGMAVAQAAMMLGRLTIAAACVGGMKRCAQLMYRYSSRRTVASGVLLRNPLLGERLTELTFTIETLSALVSLLAERLDRGETVPEDAYAACKILGPEWYWQAVDWLVQCLGGRGYIETNLVAQMLRDARVLRIFEGPTETLAAYLGARVHRRPADLLDFVAVLDGSGQSIIPLNQVLADVTGDEGRFERNATRYGELAALTLALAALIDSGRGNADVGDWLRQRIEGLCRQLQGCEARLLQPVSALSQCIQAYAGAIGDIDQYAAGEERTPDVWLRRNADPEPDAVPIHVAVPPQVNPAQLAGIERVEAWLRDWLADRLKLDAAAIDSQRAFADYGIDSVLAVELVHELEGVFGLSQHLDPTLAWSYPSVATLARFVAELQGAAVVADPVNKSTDELVAELAAELSAGEV